MKSIRAHSPRKLEIKNNLPEILMLRVNNNQLLRHNRTEIKWFIKMQFMNQIHIKLSDGPHTTTNKPSLFCPLFCDWFSHFSVIILGPYILLQP